MKLGAFMQSAIEEYYANAEPFGQKGDFVTAPEISQMFGEMIAVWITDIWMQLDKPDLNIIEFGPGRGTLMADILRVLSKTVKPKVFLIENSNRLIEVQKNALKSHDVTWVEKLDHIQNGAQSIIIGNEFLDSLPIEQLMRSEKGWQMRVVEKGKMDWRTAEKQLIDYLPSTNQSNVIYEISPERIKFVKNCERFLEKSGGTALFFDYGYTTSHHGETLQAVKNHKYVDVLQNAGQADITSHVDFDALIREINGRKHVTTQRLFLMNLGIEQRTEILSKQKDVSQDLKRLIAPDQMGQLFKVLCFHNLNITPAGF